MGKRDNYLIRTYGIDEKDWSRLNERQGGVCSICEKEKELCVDHDHETGVIRGLLCRSCNMIVGIYEKFCVKVKGYLGERDM